MAFGTLMVGYALMACAPGIVALLPAVVVRSLGAATLWVYSTLLLQYRVENRIQGGNSSRYRPNVQSETLWTSSFLLQDASEWYRRDRRGLGNAHLPTANTTRGRNSWMEHPRIHSDVRHFTPPTPSVTREPAPAAQGACSR